MKRNKLVFKTVQFGPDYGVANQKGQVELSEIKSILELAKNEHVDTLDTAIGYGDSEERLGKVGVSQWDEITKLPAFSD